MRPTLIERLRRDRESGQATTEFALVFIPLIMVVAGIIYFGIGLSEWALGEYRGRTLRTLPNTADTSPA